MAAQRNIRDPVHDEYDNIEAVVAAATDMDHNMIDTSSLNYVLIHRPLII